jgi:hypothetical protein
MLLRLQLLAAPPIPCPPRHAERGPRLCGVQRLVAVFNARATAFGSFARAGLGWRAAVMAAACRRARLGCGRLCDCLGLGRLPRLAARERRSY